MKNNKNRKIKYIKILLVLFIFFTSAVLFESVAETEAQVIKVGFYSVNGFTYYNEYGKEEGYNVEYLNKISKYTGWKYEYIKTESWQEALKMLENGTIDILGPAVKTKSREEKFGYSTYSIGIQYPAIITRKDNKELEYEDLGNLNGKKIGCVENLVFIREYNKYKKQNGFDSQLRFYKTQKEVIEALNKGEIDAMLDSLMVMTDEYKLVAKFLPQSVYYIVNKDNDKLLMQLDSAMESMKVEYTDFENDLSKKFFPQFKQIPFTREELEYIKNAPVFRIACISNLDPISYINKENGKVEGINKEILSLVSDISGLKFEYIPLPDKEILYEDFIQNDIDLISGVENNAINNMTEGIKLSEPYFTSQKVIVGRKGEIFSENDNFKVAVPVGEHRIEKMIKLYYPNVQIVMSKNLEECMQKVKSGKADVLIKNQYAVKQYMAKPQYESLAVVYGKSIPEQLCLSPVFYDNNQAKKEVLEDERLISIINKSIFRLEQNKLESIVIGQTTGRPYKYTGDDFIYKYRNIMGGSILIALILLMTFSCIARFSKKNKAIIAASERKLRNVTNNIDGGVIVLLPQKDFKIIYNNEGFLDLIGISKEEYKGSEAKYSDFVHEEDFIKLEEMYNSIERKEEKFSLELRVYKKAGKGGRFIHTLFNGTLTENIHGEKELCCVIMDITEQNRMREKLEMEQERYQTFMEKSEALIFDYDTVKGSIVVSKEFKEKFGWSLPKLFWGSDLTQVWPVHVEERKLFRDMVEEVFKGAGDGNCQARIMTLNSQYIWCDINFHMIRKNGKNSRVVGTVLDIDKEMREREALLQKSKTDGLTGLLNKESFECECKEFLTERKDEITAVVFIDLDNFKNINDELGHMVGDIAIKEAADKIKSVFKEDSIISRFGGDEFCILVKDIKGKYNGDKIEEFRAVMEQTYSFKNKEIKITASMGIATTNSCGNNFNTLLECADKALYEAKKQGKNSYAYY
ncbi:MAG: diguanylate cyclase [Aminipila sp.]